MPGKNIDPKDTTEDSHATETVEDIHDTDLDKDEKEEK